MCQFRQQQGFTLVEGILVMMIISIISIVVGRMLFEAFKNFQIAETIAEVDWRGFLSLERITNDLHTIRSPNDITTATATMFSFLDVGGNMISYQYSGTALTRNSQPLSTGINAFSFSYLDKNGAATAILTNIRYINIELTAAQNNFSQSYSTGAALRFS